MSEQLGECVDSAGNVMPAYGRQILFRRHNRDPDWLIGRVKYHWISLDADAVAVECADGEIANLLLCFGDEWQYTP